MQVLVLDPNAVSREALVVRVREALHQTRLRRADVVDGDLNLLIANAGDTPPALAFLGPGSYEQLEQSIARFRSFYPKIPLAVVLDNAIYAAEAIDLRRIFATRIIAIADLAQIAQFILDCSGQTSESAPGTTQGIVTVTHCKGGVGATTTAAALAECWATHGLSVALVDLDDVNPELTDWAEVPQTQRQVVSELLRHGAVPFYRLPELVTPVKGYSDSFGVVGMPELYQESFHYKADILENVPSGAEFLRSLVHALHHQYDVVVIDAANSWGTAAFAALTLSQHILFVAGSDDPACRRSLKSLYRFYRESEDVAEFDFTKWRIVSDQTTSRGGSDLRTIVQEADFLPSDIQLAKIEYSDKAREWCFRRQGFYTLAGRGTRESIEQLAFSLFPFRPMAPQVGSPWREYMGRLTGFLG